MVGGGLSGLFAASELVQRGLDDVVVLEASPLAGGVARTVERRGFTMEPAVGSFNLPHPHLTPLLDRAAVKTQQAAEASLRHVFVDGRLVAVPPSPRALLAPLLGVRSKLRVMVEPLVAAKPVDDESLAGFARRRFGEGSGELISWLMATGVFAGDPHLMSAEAAFPSLVELERAHGSVLVGALRRRRPSNDERPRTHVPKGGMSAMVESLADALGDRFRPGFAVESVRREGRHWTVDGPERLTADAVVLAVPPVAAAGLVEGELGDVLRQAVAAPVVVMFLGGAAPSPLPDGFGALVGPGEGLSTRGILFESSYAPVRATAGSWLAKVIVGGATDASVVDRADDRLIPGVVAEVESILGEELVPDFVEVVRHRPGIPQYGVGHRRWLTAIADLLATAPGLHLTGWAYRGVGIANLATDAVRVANAITRS